MPIYAYRCESCGFEKDVLQKMSDAPLTQCPECGNDTLRKQLTAAGFQLKGSGWYVTDFRSGSNGANSGAPGAAASEKKDGADGGNAATTSDGGAASAAATSTTTTTTSAGAGASNSGTAPTTASGGAGA